ncbi:hypothetical protein [Sphingomonas azotifigens]|uniref:hypothetical protein n=1 Tax=Sphingomonas azotifigens TaxID=330920 RepID=UPI000A06E74F|nr:hypothetical protein [Sphingomonas azotifigens]
MRVAIIRRYLKDALEFFGYFVFMTVLGASMYVLVNYAPQANSRWYINTCIGMAIFTGLYAWRMFRRYRKAMRRLRALEALSPELIHEAVEAGRKLRWSERIAAERLEARGGDPERVKLLDQLEAVEQAYRKRCAALGVDPADQVEDAFAIDPNMSLEAIRERIAERMRREDADEAAEEAARPPIFR